MEVIIMQLRMTAYLCLGKKSLSHESLALDTLTSPFLNCWRSFLAVEKSSTGVLNAHLWGEEIQGHRL